MSVRSGDRSQGHVQVLNSMRILEEYTFQICMNENIFPNEIGLVFALQILDKCLDAGAELADAFHTNPILPDDLPTRRAHQTECHSHLNSLLHLIENAWKACHIPSRRIEYWTGLVVVTEKNLDVWIASDLRRYRRLTK
jgi:hypothetical protein